MYLNIPTLRSTMLVDALCGAVLYAPPRPYIRMTKYGRHHRTLLDLAFFCRGQLFLKARGCHQIRLCRYSYMESVSTLPSYASLHFIWQELRDILSHQESCDCYHGVIPQCMQAAHVLKNDPQYQSNVCMKSNAKLGGTTGTVTVISLVPDSVIRALIINVEK